MKTVTLIVICSFFLNPVIYKFCIGSWEITQKYSQCYDSPMFVKYISRYINIVSRDITLKIVIRKLKLRCSFTEPL